LSSTWNVEAAAVKHFGRQSILVRSTAAVVASFLLAGALTIAATIVVTGQRQERAANERLNQLLDTVERTVSVACFVNDAKLADEVAQGLLKNKEVLAVAIRADGVELARQALPGAPADALGGGGLTRVVHSPFAPAKIIGRIQVAVNSEAIARATREEVRFVILQIIGQLALIALAVVAVMLVFIVRPIKAMSDGLHRMDATTGERLAVPGGHADSEIGRLVVDINTLAGELVDALGQERTLRVAKELEEKKYHSIFENAETGIFIVAPDGTLTSWNPAFARLMSIPPYEAYRGGLNLRQLPWENPSRATELALHCWLDNSGLADDLTVRLRNGIWRWLNVILTPIGENLLQGVVHDVTEHKEAEASAKRMAVTDRLTGVTNRLGLEERLQRLLDNPLVTQTGGFTLILADLDNFRRINEGFGLPIGDAIIRDATARLSHCIKGGDTIARMSGDRFALALESLSLGDDIDRIAERLLAAIRKPFYVDGSPVNIHVSLGIAVAPRDGASVPDLLRNVELALDRAKGMGGNGYVFFDPTLAEAAERRRTLENDLRRAAREHEFQLYFQPIVHLAEHRLAGAEALIRWPHPERGMVPPDAFIPLAEEIGLIDEIGLWTLDTACAQLAAWQAAGHGDRYLSVNVSARQIPDGLPPAILAETVEHHGVDPTRLALEITEGVLLADIERAQAWLDAVRARGFRIYLDDFGTGYSSLSYLKRFPIDTLKIDQSFVRDMGEDGSDRALIEAVIAMAHGLGMTVIAEGVETAEQARLLRQMNCHHGQGYLYSRPVPADQFEAAASAIAAMSARHNLAAS
jgi:diguanylate cyclase (GGDEF)-like protein/PAS domain S-box-containing protein